MSTTAMQPLPPEVGNLGNFDLRITRNLRAAVEDWDEVCSALGPWEAGHLTGPDATRTKVQHRAWVMKLISWGQLMRRMTDHPDFPDPAVPARVKARLRHLEDKLALWHTDMSSEEAERILRCAFA